MAGTGARTSGRRARARRSAARGWGALGWSARLLVGAVSGTALLLAPAGVVHAGGGAAAADGAGASAPARAAAEPRPAAAQPAPTITVIRMSDLASRFGLARTGFDMLSGRTVYGGAGHVVVVAPGLRQALVDGKAIALGRAVGCFEGDLLIPLEALPAIERALGGPQPVAARAPAPVAAPAAPTPAPAPRAAPAPRPRRAPGSAGTVVVDPGHGGKFTGARGQSGLFEKDVNLAIAFHLRDLLEERGFRVVLTRDDDRPLHPTLNADLEARAEMANRLRADLFVSVHANHAEARDVSGFEVYHAADSRTSGQLAREVHRALKGRIDDADRGVKTAGFRVLRHARVPAVLVETGFLSHAGSERKLGDGGYQRRLAEAIADGVEAFHGR